MGRRLQTYATDSITVTYDPTRCMHAAECVRRLPLVFDTSRKRWIDPQQAQADDVAQVVRQCPSGALQYALPEHAPEAGDERPSVRVTHSGPLYVRGDVILSTESGTAIAAGTRFALCRCGASRQKPFCDGSHHAIAFSAE